MNDSNKKSSMLDSFDNLDANDLSLEQLFNDSEEPKQLTAPAKADLSVFNKIPVKLTLEVDSVEIELGELLNLNAGEVLPLDKKVGAPLDVRVNGTLIARAEVVVVDGKYGLRLIEVLENINMSGITKNS